MTGGRQRLLGWWYGLSAPQLFVASFALLVALGTVGLKTLPGLYTGEPLGWLDALFTATSAVCVTGLIVVDTATYFTFWGQLFILVLVQLGGLGIIAFTSVIIVALGRRMSLRHEALSGASIDYDVAPHVSRKHLVRDVVRFTLLLEAVGAVVLYLLWAPRMGWGAAAWPAVFHSVNAFCNAGFSTFSDSMMGFRREPATLLVVTLLVVLGGLGFLTLEELILRYKAARRGQAFRVSLHSRIVLVMTAVLLVAAWPLFVLFEWSHTLGDLPWWHKVSNGLFMSATPRSGGFNTIDYAQAQAPTNFLTILLMAAGGSPGSTAGGLKTTTIFLIGLLAWARLRGRAIPSVWGRSVPEETVQRAVGVYVLVFGMVTAGIFVLTATELVARPDRQFLSYMFEAASAFNTVGLSMGATDDLSTGGRWTAVVLMFVGRVGPLTFAAALTLRQSWVDNEFRYAYEDVVVG